jgi:hypothetical protein
MCVCVSGRARGRERGGWGEESYNIVFSVNKILLIYIYSMLIPITLQINCGYARVAIRELSSPERMKSRSEVEHEQCRQDRTGHNRTFYGCLQVKILLSQKNIGHPPSPI